MVFFFVSRNIEVKNLWMYGVKLLHFELRKHQSSTFKAYSNFVIYLMSADIILRSIEWSASFGFQSWESETNLHHCVHPKTYSLPPTSYCRWSGWEVGKIKMYYSPHQQLIERSLYFNIVWSFHPSIESEAKKHYIPPTSYCSWSYLQSRERLWEDEIASFHKIEARSQFKFFRTGINKRKVLAWCTP